MFANAMKKVFGTKQDRDIKNLMPIVQEINKLEEKMKSLSDQQLQQQTEKFKQLLKNGSTLDDILVEAYATVREASVRVLQMRPFDVQIMGAITLHSGKIAEMKTGEGKTLTSTMPVYLNALQGKGAHLVTVNDYLAARDAEEMGELYQWLGLSVGCILSNMDDEDRKLAYQADITYGTNNEFAFDYLRDNMKFTLEDYVQRGHNYCIVDEVDSILIDEARTPLLISGPSEGDTSLYHVVNKVIPQLEKDVDYTVDEKGHTAILSEEGIQKCQDLLKVDNLYDIQNIALLHHLNQSLRAHSLFTKDVDYVVKEGKVIIVDEFTGRLKEGSRWSDGLHGAVEAKENVNIKTENQTLASITFQNYFKLYSKLAGMTGTADTEAEEFNKIYNLEVVVIPTNLPMVRKDHADVIYATKDGKYQAVTDLIKTCHKNNQPVLVGTISIESSEIISRHLSKAGIEHEVLNAKQHSREAEIIKNAGMPGSVTIATNMAGRGTDIKLNEETKTAGGLYIIGTERHESRRIDNQLRGRSGRQGDPGASKFFLSLEDDLMRVFGSDRIRGLMTKMGFKDDEPIEHKMITNAIAKAQKKVEAHNFDIRKHLLDFDNVMNEQRKSIYQLRRDILNDNDNRGLIDGMIEDVADFMNSLYLPEKKIPIGDWDWEKISQAFQDFFNTDYQLNVNECADKFEGDLTEYIFKTAVKILDEKFSRYEAEQVKITMREVLLANFDSYWKNHLQSMDQLKEGINLRAYGQKDPLVEYKREAFQLFLGMKEELKKAIVQTIFEVKLYTKEEIEEFKRIQREQLEAQLAAHRAAQEQSQQSTANAVQRKTMKVGRNDLCPCGSGKKFKHCHGA